MKRRISVALSLALLITCLIPALASAQLLSDPKGDIMAPDGTKIYLFYYRHISASDTYKYGKYVAASDYTFDTAWFRYAHYGKLGPVSYLANVIVPWGQKQQTVTAGRQTSSGLGDVLLAFGVWPVITERFQFAFNYTVGVPTGDYRHEKSVNMGANMWQNQPELIAVWFVVPKRLTLEVNSAINYVSTNTDYTVASKSLARTPLYITSGHLTLDLTPKSFISASGYYQRGGQLAVDGATQEGTDIATVGVMGTVAFWLDKFQVMTQYQQDLDVRYGAKTSAIRVRLAYIF